MVETNVRYIDIPRCTERGGVESDLRVGGGGGVG